MFEKIKILKNVADWFLNLDVNKKFVLFLIIIIASLAYINYANRRDFKSVIQKQDSRYNSCITRSDSLVTYYSILQIRLEREKAREISELIKRYEKKIEELYIRTDKIYADYHNKNK